MVGGTFIQHRNVPIVPSGVLPNNLHFGNKMMKRIIYILTAIAIITFGCTKPFSPTSVSTNANILVVEGFINTGDSTIIQLSRTVIIANKTTANPETKAIITVENAQGT